MSKETVIDAWSEIEGAVSAVAFDEKSVWIQLVGTLVGLGAYAAVASTMMSSGVEPLAAYVPVFAVAVALNVAILVAGHALAAVTGRAGERDERDRLIEWRSESGSAWLLATGVIAALAALVVALDPVWIAHVLLVSLFASTLLKYALQIVFYRRGI